MCQSAQLRVVNELFESGKALESDENRRSITMLDFKEIFKMRKPSVSIEMIRARGPLMRRFLDACGVSPHAVRGAERTAREMAREAGGAIVEVRIGDSRSDVEVTRPALPQRDDVAFSGSDLI